MSHKHEQIQVDSSYHQTVVYEQTIEERLESVERVLGLRGPQPIRELSVIEALKQYAAQLDYAAQYQQTSYADFRGIAEDLRRIVTELEQYDGLHVPRGKRDRAA